MYLRLRSEQKLENKRQRCASNKSLLDIFVHRSEIANYGGENSNIWIRHLVQKFFSCNNQCPKNVPSKRRVLFLV